jgi:hypothetical protein
MMTGADGMFSMTVPAGTISVTRPAWHSVDVEWAGEPNITITLEPRIVRAVRVSKYVAADPEAFARLLDLADTTIVDTLVFDTKDESGSVLYESNVAAAREYGAIRPMYDPFELLAAAKEHGLYTITRVVSFEDDIWVRQNPAAKLLGSWVDMRDVANWEYPLALAVEACELGFDEIQFDYVRFPAGKTTCAFPPARPERPSTLERIRTRPPGSEPFNPSWLRPGPYSTRSAALSPPMFSESSCRHRTTRE